MAKTSKTSKTRTDLNLVLPVLITLPSDDDSMLALLGDLLLAFLKQGTFGQPTLKGTLASRVKHLYCDYTWTDGAAYEVLHDAGIKFAQALPLVKDLLNCVPPEAKMDYTHLGEDELDVDEPKKLPKTLPPGILAQVETLMAQVIAFIDKRAKEEADKEEAERKAREQTAKARTETQKRWEQQQLKTRLDQATVLLRFHGYEVKEKAAKAAGTVTKDIKQVAK